MLWRTEGAPLPSRGLAPAAPTAEGAGSSAVEAPTLTVAVGVTIMLYIASSELQKFLMKDNSAHVVPTTTSVELASVVELALAEDEALVDEALVDEAGSDVDSDLKISATEAGTQDESLLLPTVIYDANGCQPRRWFSDRHGTHYSTPGFVAGRVLQGKLDLGSSRKGRGPVDRSAVMVAKIEATSEKIKKSIRRGHTKTMDTYIGSPQGSSAATTMRL